VPGEAAGLTVLPRWKNRIEISLLPPFREQNGLKGPDV